MSRLSGLRPLPLYMTAPTIYTNPAPTHITCCISTFWAVITDVSVSGEVAVAFHTFNLLLGFESISVPWFGKFNNTPNLLMGLVLRDLGRIRFFFSICSANLASPGLEGQCPLYSLRTVHGKGRPDAYAGQGGTRPSTGNKRTL